MNGREIRIWKSIPQLSTIFCLPYVLWHRIKFWNFCQTACSASEQTKEDKAQTVSIYWAAFQINRCIPVPSNPQTELLPSFRSIRKHMIYYFFISLSHAFVSDFSGFSLIHRSSFMYYDDNINQWKMLDRFCLRWKLKISEDVLLSLSTLRLSFSFLIYLFRFVLFIILVRPSGCQMYCSLDHMLCVSNLQILKSTAQFWRFLFMAILTVMKPRIVQRERIRK